MASKTILIVDDTAVTLKLLARIILRKEEYKVRIASTAEQTLSTLRTLQPDLVLVGVPLPGIDATNAGGLRGSHGDPHWYIAGRLRQRFLQSPLSPGGWQDGRSRIRVG